MRHRRARGIYSTMEPGTRRQTRYKNVSFLSAVLVLVACASAPLASTVIRTFYDLPARYAGFNNMLIIGVAGDYESRALFERALTTAFADSRGQATAYHTVVGRQPELTRTTLETAILSRRFDAVLLTRLKGQEREELVANRPVGQSFDLFGYDYAELNFPASIERAPSITFVTEVYSTADQKKIWAIDSLSFDKATATELIIEQANTIASQIRKDRVLAP